MINTNLNFTGERLIPKINQNTAFYYEHINRYLFVNQFSNNKMVLDCACGTGYGSYLISKYGHAKNITAIDISKESINYAKKYYSLKNITYKKDNVQILKTITNNSIDLIASFETIEHINNPELAIIQFKRVLKKNGLLVVSTPNVKNYPKGNQFHYKELNLTQFSKLLQKNFKYIKILGQKYFLSQQIFSFKQEKDIKFNQQKLYFSNHTDYSPKSLTENSEYFIALCSDSVLPKFTQQQMSVNQIDNLNLNFGIIPLEKEIYQLTNKLNKTQSKLNELSDSQLFRLWPIYKKLKKILKR